MESNLISTVDLAKVFNLPQLDSKQPYIFNKNILRLAADDVAEIELITSFNKKVRQQKQDTSEISDVVNTLYAKAIVYSLSVSQIPEEQEKFMERLALTLEERVTALFAPATQHIYKTQSSTDKRKNFGALRASSKSRLPKGAVQKNEETTPPESVTPERKSSSGSEELKETRDVISPRRSSVGSDVLTLISPRLETDSSDEDPEDSRIKMIKKKIIAMNDEDFKLVNTWLLAKFRGEKPERDEVKKFKKWIHDCTPACFVEANVLRYLASPCRQALASDIERNMNLFVLKAGEDELSFQPWDEKRLSEDFTHLLTFFWKTLTTLPSDPIVQEWDKLMKDQVMTAANFTPAVWNFLQNLNHLWDDHFLSKLRQMLQSCTQATYVQPAMELTHILQLEKNQYKLKFQESKPIIRFEADRKNGKVELHLYVEAKLVIHQVDQETKAETPFAALTLSNTLRSTTDKLPKWSSHISVVCAPHEQADEKAVKKHFDEHIARPLKKAGLLKA